MKNITLIYFILLCSSCTDNDVSRRYVKDSIHGVDFTIEHFSGPALSRSEDRIYANTGSKIQLIFDGFGAKDLSIMPLEKGVVIVKYCGGSIQETGSFLANRPDLREAVAVVVQPVVIDDIEIRGHRICSE